VLLREKVHVLDTVKSRLDTRHKENSLDGFEDESVDAHWQGNADLQRSTCDKASKKWASRAAIRAPH